MAKDETDRRVLRPRNRRPSRHHDGDSGLGTSIESSAHQKTNTTTTKASTITRSASSNMETVPALGSRAVNRIHEHILRPLRAKPSLRDFEPIVLDIPRRIHEKEIICLRDLEKTLIFMAPERTKTAALYLDFCLTSIRCIQATVEYLSDREQIRSGDRPYTNGYFIDLVEQIRQYAGQLAAAKDRAADNNNTDTMDVDITDEVKLYGGLHENGRPAELVRVRKDGKAVSMATGELVDLDDDVKSPMKFKRSLSEELEDEEEMLRSMARRKKNASPDEYAPKKCREPGCNKEFKRPCDLTKHEKTHSRPWKCPVPTCKYHEYGWPTEKEMDRHHNDKHSSSPDMFECMYKPCPYKSKRQSNCKQHMEKAHGWTYVRTKTNGKKSDSKPGSVQHPTPLVANMPTPPSSIATPPQDSLMRFPNLLDFPTFPSDNGNILTDLNHPDMLPEELDFSFDANTPSTEGSYTYTFQEGPGFTVPNHDIYNNHVQVPTPNPDVYGKIMPTTAFTFPAVAQMPEVPHISPMLYTPNSMADVDEGFEDYQECDMMGGDFQLFDSPGVGQLKNFEPLFGEVPSAGLGFSQASQDFFPTSQMDWLTSQAFHEQPQH